MTTLPEDEAQQAEEVALMLGGTAWGIVKTKLDAKILDLQNINNIDTSSGVSLETQILGRKLASDLLFAWLKNDLYGFVEQQTENRLKQKEPDNGFIEVLKDDSK